MSRKHVNTDIVELDHRESLDSHTEFDLDDLDAESQPLAQSAYHRKHPSAFINHLFVYFSRFRRRQPFGTGLRRTRSPIATRLGCLRRPSLRRFLLVSYAFLAIVVSLVLATALFFPSYTKPPSHYQHLQTRARSSSQPGRINPRQEKVFIAASIYDQEGQLAGGPWGKNVLDLIQSLGPDNVYLSIYENGVASESKEALEEFEKRVPCAHSVVFEEHLDLGTIPHVKLPDGTDRVKRIAYLAEVRNRALQPLLESEIRWNKILYLNDVLFDPIEAAQLLFSTNADANGRADYRAACAVDFINAFKFYDTFATRDLEGYGMGVPFFPWFTAAGEAQSLRDVLAGKDAVQVRSCWGGMVAFDARYFQGRSIDEMEELYAAGDQMPRQNSTLARFRAEEDLYWDASECCLIHADIQKPEAGDTGIYMNPYVRVAYDTHTLSWLHFTRRFERLYSPIHYLIDTLVGMPWENPRRAEQAWQEVEETVWVADESFATGGSFQVVNRIATHSGFCGRRALQVMREKQESGQKNWEMLPVP